MHRQHAEHFVARRRGRLRPRPRRRARGAFLVDRDGAGLDVLAAEQQRSFSRQSPAAPCTATRCGLDTFVRDARPSSVRPPAPLRLAAMPTSSRFAVAIHILAGLTLHSGEPLPSEIIAKSAHTNPAVIRRLLSMLNRAGLTSAQLGQGGGALLARPAERSRCWRSTASSKTRPCSPCIALARTRAASLAATSRRACTRRWIAPSARWRRNLERPRSPISSMTSRIATPSMRKRRFGSTCWTALLPDTRSPMVRSLRPKLTHVTTTATLIARMPPTQGAATLAHGAPQPRRAS